MPVIFTKTAAVAVVEVLVHRGHQLGGHAVAVEARGQPPGDGRGAG